MVLCDVAWSKDRAFGLKVPMRVRGHSLLIYCRPPAPTFVFYTHLEVTKPKPCIPPQSFFRVSPASTNALLQRPSILIERLSMRTFPHSLSRGRQVMRFIHSPLLPVSEQRRSQVSGAMRKLCFKIYFQVAVTQAFMIHNLYHGIKESTYQ